MLLSLLLAAVTFNPAAAPAQRFHSGPMEGYIAARSISPDNNCKPGAICASTTFNINGCFFNNFWNGSKGGTPLTIDVTQTGGNGSKVYVYWVNATNKTISIAGQAQAKYFCP